MNKNQYETARQTISFEHFVSITASPEQASGELELSPGIELAQPSSPTPVGQRPVNESPAVPVAADLNARIYRIDDRHDRFQPGGLLAEPRLHVSVKAIPAAEQVGIEQILRQKRAIRFSQGTEVQQILVSTYEAVQDCGPLPGDDADFGNVFSAGTIQLDLPHWDQRGPTIAREIETAERMELQFQAAQPTLEAISVTAEPEPLKVDELRGVPGMPPETGMLTHALPAEATADDDHSGKPETAESQATNAGSADEEAGKAESRDHSAEGNSASVEVVKPAWEVVAFRWPSSIRKLCSEHKNAFRRLLDSLQTQSTEFLSRIGVVHAVPGQGATTLSVCLSKILADSGLHVLLADFDLESPGLENAANIQLNQGWQELLDRNQSINEYLVKDASENLTLLPLRQQSGLTARRPLLLEKLQQLTVKFGSQFDYSIIDIGNIQNLMLEEKCHVGFLDAVVIVSDATGRGSTAVSIYEKLVAAGVRSVVIAENFRSDTRSAA